MSDKDMAAPPTPPWEVKPVEGMSLRDWFAGMLIGSIASCFSANSTHAKHAINESKELDVSVPDLAAITAYKFADAMLKARAQD